MGGRAVWKLEACAAQRGGVAWLCARRRHAGGARVSEGVRGEARAAGGAACGVRARPLAAAAAGGWLVVAMGSDGLVVGEQQAWPPWPPPPGMPGRALILYSSRPEDCAAAAQSSGREL